MSWVATAIGGSAVLGGIGTATGGFGSRKKGKGISLPPFYEDPLYKDTQAYLGSFSKDMLAGNVPDYFKNIGETGGANFENMMAMINRDTSKSVNENLVRRGISRSGVGLSTMAKTSSDVNTKLRWEDYARSLTGKQYLLNTGLGAQSDVRTAALNNQSQRNTYQTAGAGLQLQMQGLQDKNNAQTDAMWSQLLSSSIGAVGSYMGAKGGRTTGGGISNISGSGYNRDSLDLSGLTGFGGSTAPKTYGSAAYYQDPKWKYGGYSFN